MYEYASLYMCICTVLHTFTFFFIKLTMQTPMHGEEEKAEAAILAAFVHWPCATARAWTNSYGYAGVYI